MRTSSSFSGKNMSTVFAQCSSKEQTAHPSVFFEKRERHRGASTTCTATTLMDMGANQDFPAI
jgi:hypothetical protein